IAIATRVSLSTPSGVFCAVLMGISSVRRTPSHNAVVKRGDGRRLPARLRPVPVLHAQDLHKSFGPQRILAGVTVTIRTGERVGLVGINGSGKSTLARILASVEQPDAGAVSRQRDAEIAYLDQDPVFDGTLTPRHIVLAGLSAWSLA